MRKPDSITLDHGTRRATRTYANIAEYRKAQARRWETIRKARAVLVAP
jgi:hypothetical protein